MVPVLPYLGAPAADAGESMQLVPMPDAALSDLQRAGNDQHILAHSGVLSPTGTSCRAACQVRASASHPQRRGMLTALITMTWRALHWRAIHNPDTRSAQMIKTEPAPWAQCSGADPIMNFFGGPNLSEAVAALMCRKASEATSGSRRATRQPPQIL